MTVRVASEALVGRKPPHAGIRDFGRRVVDFFSTTCCDPNEFARCQVADMSVRMQLFDLWNGVRVADCLHCGLAG